MTTRPKKNKKKAKAKKAAKKKSAARKAAAKKKSANRPSKTRGAKSARPFAKRATASAASSKGLKRAARRRLALLGVSGRRPKSVAQRGPARGRVSARPRVGKPVAAAPRVPGVAIKAPLRPRYTEILTPAALRFLAELHRAFEAARERILAARAAPKDEEGQAALPEASASATIITALGSDPQIELADFGNANAAKWSHRIEAQIALKDRWSGKGKPSGRDGPEQSNAPAALIVRPRGWHVVEEQVTIDGAPISGALFDFGLYIFHNAMPQTAAGASPRLHLPKAETPEEIELWNDVFAYAQERLGLPAGTIRASASVDGLLEGNSA
jgi:hypothetical protein